MKSLPYVLFALLLSFSTVALAQPNAHEHKSADPVAQPAPSEARQSFKLIKGLAGAWTGTAKIDPPQADDEKVNNKPLRVTLRVTSRGNALVHEMGGWEEGMPKDPTQYDNPIT